MGHSVLGDKAPWNIAGLAGIAFGELLGAYGFGGEPAAHKADCQQQKADACVGSRVEQRQQCMRLLWDMPELLAAGSHAAAQSGSPVSCYGTEAPVLYEMKGSKRTRFNTSSWLLLLWCHSKLPAA